MIMKKTSSGDGDSPGVVPKILVCNVLEAFRHPSSLAASFFSLLTPVVPLTFSW